MKIMTKIKELLASREKLARYDELTKWKEYFERNNILSSSMSWEFGLKWDSLPDHIKGIIVSALDAEIKKLDEE